MDFREKAEVLNGTPEKEKADAYSREEGRKSTAMGKSRRKNSEWRKKPSLERQTPLQRVAVLEGLWTLRMVQGDTQEGGQALWLLAYFFTSNKLCNKLSGSPLQPECAGLYCSEVLHLIAIRSLFLAFSCSWE